MQLTEAEPLTALMRMAIEDGIETVEQYEVWLLGYMTGYRKRQAEIEVLRGEL